MPLLHLDTEVDQSKVQPTWRLALRGIEVRLRFVVALLLLAGLMFGWPWLRQGWQRLDRIWHRHGPASTVSADSEYFCPMDPGIVSAWPAICPICNMDLITRKKTDTVILPEGVVTRMQLSPYRIQLAGVRTSTIQPSATEDSSTVLSVPCTAVVRHGDEDIVYVETMPGMFDGVKVKLGPRDGDFYSILEGLLRGQQVVTAGAFLIDAECRLHSGLATKYFGASGLSSRQPALPKRRDSKSTTEPFTEADLALIKQQRICPVTDAPLGSMGKPVVSLVHGRKVFLCCKGCEASLQANADKYLAKLNENHDRTDGAPKKQQHE